MTVIEEHSTDEGTEPPPDATRDTDDRELRPAGSRTRHVTGERDDQWGVENLTRGPKDDEHAEQNDPDGRRGDGREHEHGEARRPEPRRDQESPRSPPPTHPRDERQLERHDEVRVEDVDRPSSELDSPRVFDANTGPYSASRRRPPRNPRSGVRMRGSCVTGRRATGCRRPTIGSGRDRRRHEGGGRGGTGLRVRS